MASDQPAANPTIVFDIDPAHRKMGFMFPGLVKDVWRDKYAQPDEIAPEQTARRVVEGVYIHDNDATAKEEAYVAMRDGLFMPAGRILAGAGTKKRVTLMNCYVTGTIEDSMEGIMREHTNFALTMQQGGGDGADFSPIRPEGAILTRTGTKASGPLPFMDMWNSMCTTIRSAGDRRGAMMATMKDTHPDLPKYIVAKKTKGRLTNFNLSILVSDAFMSAVAEDEQWLLHFHIEPIQRASEDLVDFDFFDNDGVKQYVYAIWRARDLWTLITETTYEYSEPGVIFIDRVNEFNNLQYCETISCTNPCGEQPLPPHGSCNLGHVNLARMVRNPFTAQAEFDDNLLRRVVRIAIRFLDNVLDVSNFPLAEQAQEAVQKRRIGLGFTGLADVFLQLGIRYGSIGSAAIAEKITQILFIESYKASIELAKDRGSFGLFDAEMYLSGDSFVNRNLPETMKDDIRKYGIRNGVLNTVAPTGTTSIYYGNVSGGIEPIFAMTSGRKVLQADGTFKQYTEMNYSYRLYLTLKGIQPSDIKSKEDLPSHFVAHNDLSIHDHILIMDRVQRWIDASISKTINIPKEMPYEEFVQVYLLAYNSGCKGCTTYRPSDIRGSILTSDSAPASTGDKEVVVGQMLRERPEVLVGHTHKIKWPGRAAAMYVTVNEDEEGNPFEILIQSKDSTASEWTTALSLMITAIFRKGGDISFISSELMQIQSVREGAWINGRFIASLPALIGQILDKVINRTKATEPGPEPKITATVSTPAVGQICPQCAAPSISYVEGCRKCSNCSFSECG